MKMTRTNRGFAKIEVEDTRGCICRVQRSSADPLNRVWVFCDDPKGVYPRDPRPLLDADQARHVARALLAFADGEDFEKETVTELKEKIKEEEELEEREPAEWITPTNHDTAEPSIEERIAALEERVAQLGNPSLRFGKSLEIGQNAVTGRPAKINNNGPATKTQQTNQ